MEGCGCLVYGVAQGLKLSIECLCIKGGLDMIVLCYATLCIHIYIYKIIYRALNEKHIHTRIAVHIQTYWVHNGYDFLYHIPNNSCI